MVITQSSFKTNKQLRTNRQNVQLGIKCKIGHFRLGIGTWVLGIGDWGIGIFAEIGWHMLE